MPELTLGTEAPSLIQILVVASHHLQLHGLRTVLTAARVHLIMIGVMMNIVNIT